MTQRSSRRRCARCARKAVLIAGAFDGVRWLDMHDVPCGRDAHGNPLASVHWDVQFLVVVPSAVDVVISDESDDLAWFSTEELPDIDASVAALVCDAELAMRQSEAQQWVTFG